MEETVTPPVTDIMTLRQLIITTSETLITSCKATPYKGAKMLQAMTYMLPRILQYGSKA